ncbi:MAG TPA: AAA family ATPase [Rhodospirillaceae bacterium]|jgi:putative ATPase|nr:replication-associated recombination protein A [Alphaproteobacteria bacterium]HBH26658.1 AAA family ATPase [Rhodospirillaceae bacterium]
MPDLFTADTPRPLADRLRPQTLTEVVGQEAVTTRLAQMVAGAHLSSLILWGPPGCGKTTIARILAREAGLPFAQLSAIFAGVKDLKAVFDEARQRGGATLLFVDEIHRFMKSQQDAFLPVLEDGTIVLIGATTENPSFELNAALLSRCQTFVLHRLGPEALDALLRRAESTAEQELPLTPEARAALIAMADGDGRYALTLAEQVFAQNEALDTAALAALTQRRAPMYDKGGDGHYDLISALHKSVRGSDPDAALYWLARMLAGGEDPHFIARRMTRMAVEDIGLADPAALPQCIAAWQAYARLGTPEGDLALAQAVVYLATAPKSVGVYKAFGAANRTAKESGSLPPPRHAVNAPTRLMKALGHGAGYVYDPDTPESFAGQDHFPEGMERRVFYRPAERGFEREISKRLAYWAKLRAGQR